MFTKTNTVEDFIDCVRRQNIKAQAEAMYKAYNTASSLLFLSVDMAGFAIFDAYYVLIKSPLYKQKGKKLINDAWRFYKSWENDYNSRFKSESVRQIYMDLADNYQDITKKHIDNLRMAILQVLTRLGVSHRTELSFVLSAQCCIEFACFVYNDYFKKQREIMGADSKTYNRFLYLGGAKKEWRKLVSFLVPIEIESAVTHDPNFKLACRCLAVQGTANDNLQRISEDVLEKDKDLVEECNNSLNLNLKKSDYE